MPVDELVPTQSVVDGRIEWRLPNGELHRRGGPAIFVPEDGTQYWYDHGELHRENGPAIVVPGRYEAWYQHGQRHRINGPAIERWDGPNEWWVGGKLRRAPSRLGLWLPPWLGGWPKVKHPRR